MASETEIANRALQKLGAKRVTSLTEDSVNARACNAAYSLVRDAELRAHPWNFAVKRVSLAADATAPAFGRARAFPLPVDFLRLLAPYPEDNLNTLDWQIEARSILTDDSSPLEVRYVARTTDTTIFDSLFVEAIASKLAYELCEQLTQSNAKKDAAARDYEFAVRQAKKANAIEGVSMKPPEDEWVTKRV